jgi:methylated-DNA-protein-cysteine methyltransferase-like protein
MALPEGFDAEVYSVVAQIPAGRVTTYGQIARVLGQREETLKVNYHHAVQKLKEKLTREL